jgi:hypothetical protein
MTGVTSRAENSQLNRRWTRIDAEEMEKGCSPRRGFTPRLKLRPASGTAASVVLSAFIGVRLRFPGSNFARHHTVQFRTRFP